ncbi:MAG: hypothetical protein ACETVX_04695 [bacterium]|nr:hypothetical protein [candidate division WOR-3 bacterium]MDH5683971.1 hypothetical protein [candidate division WOR-3 bacterium]
MSDISIAEADFLKLEQKIEKILVLIDELKQENQKQREEITRLEEAKTELLKRINLMLDRIDELL